jgi:hypothetical protein
MNTEIIDLKTIRRDLPHGAIAQIAEIAGVTNVTVSRAFSGDRRSPKLPDIKLAAAEFISAYKAKSLAGNEALKAAISL